ncbi:MAG: UvrD-helicase domain-containing protein [Deltaproteobacteria bacterium]|jgi:DNA helicase-2/ATP-dependent DNA helicase PcrA|nr:UvrD-helicase domain-containing protein [Deltaproteobacteria bacterium]
MAIEYQKILNAAQYQAVSHTGGPLLIAAGAGSGKTRTLVHRVAWLIDQGLPPQEILLLTFTRKAALEMLTRSSELVGLAAGRVSGGTFHSLAHTLLRRLSHHLGLARSFTVMDQDDSEALLGQIRSQHPQVGLFDRFPLKSAISNVLSQSVNRQKPLKEVLTRHFPHFLTFLPVLEDLAKIYARTKAERALLDFDDLLVKLVELLEGSETVRRETAGRYRHVLVDEYQDTNPLQARLTQLLGRDHENVTVVGDEAQSIYSFRGASFRNIMDFPSLFPRARIVTLEDNYRSTAPILSLAGKVISRAREKFSKKLRSVRGGGCLPVLHSVKGIPEEAGFVVQAVEERLARGMALSDMAVLFRNSSHSFELEIKLQKKGLPFTKYGGRKFLESAHVKDFLALLKTAVNPADTVSFERVLRNIPGFGPKNSEITAAWTGGDRARLLELPRAPVSQRLRDKLEPLAGLMIVLTDESETLTAKIQAALDFSLPVLAAAYPDDYPSRQTDLEEVFQIASGDDLAQALSNLNLEPPSALGRGRSPSGRPLDLTLSTIHSAKGLEWPAVFVLSAVEGRFPGPYVKNEDNIEEERRLLYVALTRAKDELLICLPREAGPEGGSFQPSRFLTGLDETEASGLWSGRERSVPDILGSLEDDASQEYDFRSLPEAAQFRRPAPFRPAGVRSPGRNPGLNAALACGLENVRPQEEIRKKKALTPPPAADPALRPLKGDRISHPVFGPGLVIKTIDDIVTIDFEFYGRKRINLTYARLAKLGN